MPRRPNAAGPATTLAWRYLRGRGLRSALTTLAVALGVMLVFGLNGITPALVEAFTRSMVSAAGRIDLTVSSAFRQPIPRDVAGTVARTPGVAAVSGEVQQPAPLGGRDLPTDAPGMLNIVGIDPATAAQVRDFPLGAGRALASVASTATSPDASSCGWATNWCCPARPGRRGWWWSGCSTRRPYPARSRCTSRWRPPNGCSGWATG